MEELNVEWEDIAPKVEEQEFQRQKKEQFDKQTSTMTQTQTGNGAGTTTVGQQSTYTQLGLAAMFGEIWNDIAVEKGYEPVNDKQSEFLNKHTARVEEKYLKDRMNIMPELETALAHFVVYVPKWLKYRRQHKDDKKEK